MIESASQPNKRALLIGINSYPNLPAYSQLRGCVNDVHAMKYMLETSFGFPATNISVLLNEQATEQGIRDAMEKLVADCQADDIIVFHFSGHGSQMAAKGHKPRGYDESIMPHDSGRMNAGFPRQVEPRDIRDTEIQEWLSRLSQKTPHITLIFDSCHSGSITRMVSDNEEEGTRLRWIPPDPLPPQSVTTAAAAVPPAGLPERSGLTREVSSSGWLPLSDKYVLLAACAAEQGAYELDHEEDGSMLRRGAFTFFLIQEINQATAHSTYRDIWEKVAIKLTSRFQKQTPQLEGAGDKQIFNVQDFRPMRYLLVTARQGDEIQLSGGAIHGLTVGSRWDIYPAGTKQTTEQESAQQGTVEITVVRPVSASAKIIEENFPGAIIPNARAVEVSHSDAETRMPVSFAAAPSDYAQAVEELKHTLAQSTLLEITDSAKNARAQIRLSLPDNVTAENNGASADKAYAGASWLIWDNSETPIMPTYPVAAPSSQLKIRENLETIWRYEKILESRNEKSALKGKVDFILLKKDAAGNWQEVPPTDDVVYQAGDNIAFRIINRSGQLIHASVLDFGLSKRIDVLYPPHGASEPIAVKRSGGDAAAAQTGGTLSVGEGDEITLFFPENLTFLSAASEGKPLLGREVFKLIITTVRHDLSFIKQSGLRRELSKEPLHPLERLIYLATTGRLQREAQVSMEPLDEWLTLERAFWLQLD